MRSALCRPARSRWRCCCLTGSSSPSRTAIAPRWRSWERNRANAMLKVRVIPCLDVTDGRVVKGVRFVDLRDAGDPAELAAAYDREGADEIVFLDITASSDARKILLDAVARTADQVFIPLAVGGGVRSVEDMGALLTHGADKVTV